MSPAVKRIKSEDASQVGRQIRSATADAAPARSVPREQQDAIERAYRQHEPHVPSLPGAVKVAILLSSAAASWFAIISLTKSFAG